MYQLSQEARNAILTKPLADYPDGLMAARIEQKVAATLPNIDGLCEDMTCAERQSVFQQKVQSEQAAFVKVYGDPFHCETFEAKSRISGAKQSVVPGKRLAIAA